MRSLVTLGLGLICLLLPAQKASANIIYSVNGVSLAGGTGGSLSGFFITNDARTAIVSYDITAPVATVGSFTFTGFDYTPSDSSVTANGLPTSFRLDSTVGGNELQLAFSSALTAAGGTVSGNSYEHEASGGNRAAAGPVTGSVPEPSTFALAGLALMGALVFARKKAAPQRG